MCFSISLVDVHLHSLIKSKDTIELKSSKELSDEGENEHESEDEEIEKDVLPIQFFAVLHSLKDVTSHDFHQTVKYKVHLFQNTPPPDKV